MALLGQDVCHESNFPSQICQKDGLNFRKISKKFARVKIFILMKLLNFALIYVYKSLAQKGTEIYF